MLHVNDDTNDELFRRAADDYFLEANGPDWPSLADKMIAAAAPAGSENKEGHRLPFLYVALKKIGNAIVQPCKRMFNAGNELKKAKKKLMAMAVIGALVATPCLNQLTEQRLFETGNQRHIFYCHCC